MHEHERLIRSVTRVASVPLVPEVKLHLLMPDHPLWTATPEQARSQGLELPYWAFAWPGGQGLARWILDHPNAVRGKRVLDVGSGGGIEGIAAALAGAMAVTCVDVDSVANECARLNALENAISVETLTDDPLSFAVTRFDCDVVLAGDLTFDEAIVTRLLPWLEEHHGLGRLVLVGDAGRVGLPARFESVGSVLAPFDGNPTGSANWTVQVRRIRS